LPPPFIRSAREVTSMRHGVSFQHAEPRIALAFRPEADRIATDRRRRRGEEVPDARLRLRAILPLCPAVGVHLPERRVVVAERDVPVAGQVLGLQQMAAGEDPARGALPERTEDPRARPAARVHRGDVAVDDLAHAARELGLDDGERIDSHAAPRFERA